MQIVIDIPEKIYSYINSQWKDVPKTDKSPISIICNAIVDSTPLPKRHGDLKDADRLLDGFFYEYCRYGDFGYRQAENLIKSSLTVIKADKEEEDGTNY